MLVSLLAPCLPGLMGFGKKVATEGAGAIAKKASGKLDEKVGEQSAAQAGKI
ncbi:MAG: hypothetical protein ACFB16_11265 [Phormidesmis sp.]